MLQFTDPERLGSKRGSRGHAWIFQGIGKRMWVGGSGNMRDHVRSGWRERVLKEMTGKEAL